MWDQKRLRNAVDQSVPASATRTFAIYSARPASCSKREVNSWERCFITGREGYRVGSVATAGRSRSISISLGDSRLHHLLNQRDRQRPVERKVDRSFGCGVAFEFVFEHLDHRSGGKQAAVIGKCGVPNQDFPELECGNTIADGLGSLGRHRGADRCAHLAQSAAGRLLNASKILVNRFRCARSLYCRSSLCGFFHSRMV